MPRSSVDAGYSPDQTTRDKMTIEESGTVGENSRGSSRDLRFSFHTQTAAGSEGKLMAVIFTVHREELLWEQLCKTNKKR